MQLGYTEIHTDLNFTKVPTLPYEQRVGTEKVAGNSSTTNNNNNNNNNNTGSNRSHSEEENLDNNEDYNDIPDGVPRKTSLHRSHVNYLVTNKNLVRTWYIN